MDQMQENEGGGSTATDLKHDRRDQGYDTESMHIRAAGGVSGLLEEPKKIKVVVREVDSRGKDAGCAVPHRRLGYDGVIQR